MFATSHELLGHTIDCKCTDTKSQSGQACEILGTSCKHSLITPCFASRLLAMLSKYSPNRAHRLAQGSFVVFAGGAIIDKEVGGSYEES